MSKIQPSVHICKNDQHVTIREATEDDAAAYLALGKAIMAESIYTLTQVDEMTLTIEQEREWLRSHIENPNHLVLVAEVEGIIVGQLDFMNGHRRLIAHTGQFGIGLHADYRDVGIGGFLLDKLIQWAGKNPVIEKINLSVHDTNHRAMAAYAKRGFQIEGARTLDLKYGEHDYVNTVLMGLKVPKN